VGAERALRFNTFDQDIRRSRKSLGPSLLSWLIVDNGRIVCAMLGHLSRSESTLMDNTGARTDDEQTRDGSSPELAVSVQSVREEYAWIQQNLPGFEVLGQGLVLHDSLAFDVITVTCGDEVRRIYTEFGAAFRHCAERRFRPAVR